jgi:hypothetical protein
LLALSPFASPFWGSNPIFFSRNFFFGSAPVLLYQKSPSWARLLFLSVRSLSTWNFSWLPQYKVGGRSGFTSKTRKSLPLTNTADKGINNRARQLSTPEAHLARPNCNTSRNTSSCRMSIL